MLLLRKAIPQTFAMPCSGCNMSYMPKERSLCKSRVAALPESFLASVVGAPTSLQAAAIDVEVDKLPARALLDAGATESYIHEELVKKLKHKSQGELSRISLASVGTSAQT